VDGYEVVIIGAGPAGIAAAIQLKRYNIEPLILEQDEIGGLLRNAHLVENYPGFPEGMSGIDLVALFQKQFKNAGVEVSFEAVLELDYRDGTFFIKTDSQEVEAIIVVIATGTKPRKLNNIKIADDIQSRIFYDIYSIFDIKEKNIAIMGAGDAAFDYALSLARNNEVVILNRSSQIKCLPLLWERCMKSESIIYMHNITVKEILKKDNNALIACIDNESNEEKQFEVDYVIGAIGREPALDFLADKLKKNLETLTKMSKLYMIGDVRNGLNRQTAIAVGDGVRAAMEIYRNRRG
jgi:thioredoxin reductase (NADPH)